MIYHMIHMLFAENLFHFKLDQPKYSIAPGDYGKLPLFHDNKRHKTLLNEFCFYVFSRFWSWQSMRDIQSIGRLIIVPSQGQTSSLLLVLQPWPMPATKNPVPTCIARLLDGIGGFLQESRGEPRLC